MPKSVEVKFLNDAWGGPNNDDDDRNLIVDKISVDGLTIQSEGEFTKYGNRDGMERMSWAGTMEYNVEQAYSTHLENYNQPDESTTPPTDDRIKVGEPVEIFSTSFEMSLEEGEKSNPSYKFAEAEGWSTASESIEVWSDEMTRDLGVQADAKNTASDGNQFIELNDVPSDVFADAGNICRSVPTELGKVYELTFDSSGRPGYDATVNCFEVSVDGKQLGSYQYDMTDKTNHDWQKNTVEFVGTGESMQLAFAETSNNDHDYGRGVSLDNISLVDTGFVEAPSDVPSTDAPTEKPDIEAPTDIPVVEVPTGKPDTYQAPIGENLVMNSSFEDHGDLNKGSWGFKESITGWQASSGNVEIQKGKHGGTTGAADGSACLELDAHGGPDTNASVFQDIRTGVEGTFKLSFSFSAREGGAGGNDVAANNLTEIYWGGEKVSTITADRKGWENFNFELPASADDDDFTRLEFKAVGTDDGVGSLIDNVSVERII